MKPFERILYPVDFSQRCFQTSCMVGEIARSLSSQLTLLHVFEGYDSLELGVQTRAYENDVSKAFVTQRGQELEDFAKNCFKDLTVHRVVRCGTPAESIVTWAKEHNTQLIIMPTRGHGQFRRLLAGSVTLKVLHDAACPVWTTAHSDALPLRPPMSLRKILCAVDLSSESYPVVSTAANLASVYGASVHLVHAISNANEAAKEGVVQELKLLVTKAANEITGKGDKADLSFDICVRAGSIVPLVRDWAVQLPADIVVVGHGHVRRHFGEFWSQMGSIIHETPCSVLSV